MTDSTAIVWRGLEDLSLESCLIERGPDGVLVQSVIEGGAAECSYTLRTTADWQFTDVVLRAGGCTLEVRRTERGWEVAGQARPDLSDAREVDISVSPLSNTLPIRRLGLAVGASADIITAYIQVPELDVTADPQRYTRISENVYLYESRDSEFQRSVTVDADGLVIEYPGLFTRVST
ncbi:putative glycolipid-binding domain-containing protein [Hoyosella sp. YIM 151337]|uniref:putative glycolipid-binding domain-containing protein n=1 Tax=Hoyosella sp. YIM 151337 TaxID=2992742 RepID=UPI002236A79D|nr:putative glycolipid-binding domain-containing protein [Hoyosella sp. YIM 151337]MCW4353033.1 putative glycolipid-binding domain-containing protein [Hoyosella sp. YIM 151337]